MPQYSESALDSVFGPAPTPKAPSFSVPTATTALAPTYSEAALDTVFGGKEESTWTNIDFAPKIVSSFGAMSNLGEAAKLDQVNAQLRKYLGAEAPVGVLSFPEASRRLQVAEMDHAMRDAPRTQQWGVDRVSRGQAPYGLQSLSKVEKSWGDFFTAYGKAADQDVVGRVVKALPRDAASAAYKGIGAGVGIGAVPFELGAQLLSPFMGKLPEAELTSLARFITDFGERVANPVPEEAGNVERGLRSAMPSVTLAGMSIAGGLAFPGLSLVNTASALGGAMQGGMSYLENTKETGNTAAGVLQGITDAAAEYFGERLGGFALLDKAKWAKGFFKGLLEFGAREVPSEAATALVQNFNQWAYQNPDKTLGQWLNEQPDALIQTVVGTLAGGGMQVGMIHAAAKMAELSYAQETAQRQQDQLTALFDTIGQSDLFRSDPESFGQFFQGVTGDAPAWVDPGKLTEALEMAGLTPDALPSLAEQGTMPGDIAVPVHELTQAFAGTGAEKELIQHIRVNDPNAPTIAESREAGNKALEAFQNYGTKALDAHKTDVRFINAREALREEYEADLALAYGDKYGPDFIRGQAELAAILYSVKADQLGLTPLQLRDGWTDAKGVRHRGYELLAATEAGPVRRAAPVATKEDFVPGRIGNILKRGNWAIITAENPMNQERTPEENAALNAKLKIELEKRGLEFEQIEGKYVEEGKEKTAPLEHPFLVRGIDSATALELGKMFDQDSVLSPQGFLYHDNTITPALGVTEHAAEPENLWSRIPSTGATFTIDMDWGNRKPISELNNGATEPGGLAQAVSEAPGLTITGVHFSQQPRSDILPSKYGTGIAGAEAARLERTTDKRLKSRAHFYVSTGRGVFPETGVGGAAHVATLPNMYDLDVDPSGFFKDKSDAGLNAGESALLDAGYAGYFTRTFGRQGAAVVFGRAIPAEHVGGAADANAQAIPAPAAQYSRTQSLRRAIMQAKDLPMGSMPADKWKATLARAMPEQFPAIEASGVFERLTGNVYRDEIARAIQPSEGELYQQEKPWYYSQLARAVEAMPAKVDNTSAANVKAWLLANADKLGAKKDELHWSGVTDWLGLQGKAKVSKADVAAYLEAGGVQVEDVVLGGGAQEVKDVGNGQWEVTSHGDRPGGNTKALITQFSGSGWERRGSFPDGGRGYRASFQSQTAEFDDFDAAVEWAKGARARVAESIGTKFASYVPPGGEPGSYRERLVTLPSSQRYEVYGNDGEVIQGGFKNQTEARAFAATKPYGTAGVRSSVKDQTAFRSSHWDQPNVLVHLRTDVVTGADGKRRLRVIEVQADKGQEWEKLRKKILSGNATQTEQERFDFLDKNFPFNETNAWVALGIKKAISIAAQEGLDGAVFATGQQNADLYDLSKQVEAINYVKKGENKYDIHILGQSGGTVLKEDAVSLERIEEIAGKEVAKKIESGEGQKRTNEYTSFTELSGLDLKVGGEGMRAFYDKIVPQVANDVLKKLGAGVKVGPVEVEHLSKEDRRTAKELKMPAADAYMLQPGFDLTPELRAKALEGLPLFQATTPKETTVRGTFRPDTLQYTLLAKADLSTFAHELGHFYVAMSFDLARQIEARATAGEKLTAGEQSILDDTNALLAWMGVTANTTVQPGPAGGELTLGQTYAPVVVVDDELLAAGKNDLKNSEYYFDVVADEGGVVPGRPRMLDKRIRMGMFSLSDVAAGWEKTRSLLRARYGDKVTLYRADAPVSERNAESITAYFGDEKLAKRYAESGRVAKAYTIPVDDIIALNAKPSGYFEFVVKIPDGGFVPQDSLLQRDEGASARAKAQGFDVENPVYHWSPSGEITQFHPFQHFGTQKAAEDRYMYPASGKLSFAELQARTRNGLPAEGATYPVFINKTKVLKLAYDSGSHDVFQLAALIGKAAKDKGFLDRMIETAFKDMSEAQVRAMAKAQELDYLLEEAEGFSVQEVRNIIKADFLDKQGDARMPDGGIDSYYSQQLADNVDADEISRYLAQYLRGKGITALSYKNSVEDPGSISYIVPDPRNVRSVHAEFKGTGARDMLEQGATPAQPGALPAGTTPLEVWHAMTLEQQRVYHEKFAETWEQYLFTGKAPTKALEPLFHRFTKWMTRVYQTIREFLAKKPNADMNPEIVAVFDRILATEQQIAATLAVREREALFKQAAEGGMTPEQFAAYLGLPEADKADAEAQLRARAMRDMKWLQNRRNKTLAALQAEAKEKRAEVLAEVRREVADRPVFQAMKWLKHGVTRNPLTGEEIQALKGHKLSIPILEEMFPADALGEKVDWAKLGYGKYGMLAKEGIHPDMLAAAFGYNSGRELVMSLLEAPNFQQEVEGITDQRMLERYGDLATPEGLSKAADEAIVTEAHTRMLATELSGLARQLGSPAVILKAAKEYAKALIDAKVIKSLKPANYTAEATRAGKKATKAWADGETAQAANFKRTELLNHAAAKEGYAAEKEVVKIIARLNRIAAVKDDSASAKNRDMDTVNAVRAILSEFGIGTKKRGERAQKYLDVVKENDPGMAAILQDLVDVATEKARDWHLLRVSELRDLHALVEGAWSLALRSREMVVDGKRVSRRAVADELIARLQEIGTKKTIKGKTHAVTAGEERTMWFLDAIAQLRRVSDWAEAKDGGTGLGAFRRYIWFAIKDPADRYRRARGDALKQYRDLLKTMAPTFKRGTIDAPELGYTFGKGSDGVGVSELTHAMLHTGNDSNKRKLLLGGRPGNPWASENADGSLDTRKWDAFVKRMQDEGVLTKAHYDFLQGVWDLLESTKPAAQKAHKAVFGRYFDEVTANAFDTPFGQYAGGYVPAMTDARIVDDAKIKALANAENENLSYALPSPARGFTKTRVEYNRPLMLDLRTLAGHLDKVLLFSYMAEPVADVRRLLSDPALAAEMGRVDPSAISELLTPWLNRAAKQIVETRGEHAFSMFDGVWRAGRRNAGLTLMFANIVNTLQQVGGGLSALVKVSPKHLLHANAMYLANPKGLTARIKEASPYMAERMESQISQMSEDMQEILLDPNVYQSGKLWLQKHTYFMQRAVDNVLGPIIWTGAFNQAKAGGGTDLDARRLADDAVRQTQGSQLAEEIARFESGSPFWRMFAQFSGWANSQANMLGTEFVKVFRDMGLRKGAGRGLYLFTFGILSTAIVSEIIVQAFRGGPDDEDKDGEYLDDWAAALGFGVLRYGAAMAPVFGQTVNAFANTWNHKPYDDRISTAPAISMFESAISAPHSVYKAIAEDGKPGKAISDVGTLLSMTLGVPVRAITKPLAYGANVEAGKIYPTDELDYARGLLTGVASPESRP